MHRLDGGEALSYVRSRRIGGDLERESDASSTIWAVRTQSSTRTCCRASRPSTRPCRARCRPIQPSSDAVKLVRMGMDLE